MKYSADRLAISGGRSARGRAAARLVSTPRARLWGGHAGHAGAPGPSGRIVSDYMCICSATDAHPAGVGPREPLRMERATARVTPELTGSTPPVLGRKIGAALCAAHSGGISSPSDLIVTVRPSPSNPYRVFDGLTVVLTWS